MKDGNVKTLLRKFAVPAILANLVSALYNIVDQIFIGQGVGVLGNAATNIAFPITTICLAVSLLIGVGAASNFNLEMGRGNQARAKKIAGSTFSTLVILGVVMILIIRAFLEPMMIAFGATENLLPYAMTFTSITSLGIPFLLLSTGGTPLIRSDGSATYSMIAIMSGALLNIVLNPIFIFGLHWGIAGSAWATVISQVVSGIMVLAYIPRFKQVSLHLSELRPSVTVVFSILSLGVPAMLNQVCVTLVQILLNNLLRSSGATSIYGADIPIAIAGIVMKLNTVFTSIILGLSQGAQPIVGFNYGAKAFDRVRSTYNLVLKWALAIGVVFWLGFQFFATDIIGIFGDSSKLYLEYGSHYLRVFLFFVFINGMQMSSAIFFSSIGKAKIGTFLSLLKQFLIVAPLLLVFNTWGGVSMIMYAAPVADLIAWIAAMVCVRRTYRKMHKQEALKLG